MTVTDDAIEYLRGREGILEAFLMDDGMSETILNEEKSTKSMTQMDVVNEAYDDVMLRKHRIAIIVDNHTFRLDKKDYAVVLMVNTKGDVVGRSLREDEIEEYRPRDDVVWMSKDFVMFLGSEFDGGERFIIPATPTPILEPVKGCKNALMAHPCTTSDMILKNSVDFDLRRKASTVIIGFDEE